MLHLRAYRPPHAGVVTPELRSVDAGELVERLSREYRSRAAANGLTQR